MGILRGIFTIFIVLVFVSGFSYISYVFFSTTIDLCSPARQNKSTVLFPFHLTDRQPNSCGYSGYDLSCDKANKTILKLPYSGGDFSVQAIDYVKQELQLRDPNNCLPQKLLSLNLSGTPFISKYYQNVSFYKCLLDHFTYGVKPVSCLSGSDDHNIYATSSYMHESTFMSSNCTLVKEISIPMQSPQYYGEILSKELNKDLRLTWSTAPHCEGCEWRGRGCREVTCSNNSGTSWVGCGTMVIFGVPFYLCLTFPLIHCLFAKIMASCWSGIVGVVCFLSNWVKDICGGVTRFRFIWVKDICGEVLRDLFSWVKNICGRGEPLVELTTSAIAPPSTTITHLNGLTLESYPKIVLGESLRLPKPDDDICSICISEYKPKETLKSIPKCNHCFHAHCIDEWLRLNPTCPICRNTP